MCAPHSGLTKFHGWKKHHRVQMCVFQNVVAMTRQLPCHEMKYYCRRTSVGSASRNAQCTDLKPTPSSPSPLTNLVHARPTSSSPVRSSAAHSLPRWPGQQSVQDQRPILHRLHRLRQKHARISRRPEHAPRHEIYILSLVAMYLAYLAYLALGFSICKSAHDERN